MIQAVSVIQMKEPKRSEAAKGGKDKMKIIEVIEKTDKLYPNSYDISEKIEWCNELGAMLKEEYAKSYLPGTTVQEGYCPIEDSMEEDTVIPAPYDAMYIDFLLAKCCYYQRDYDAYNQHIVSFNSKLEDFAKWYIERNMPVRETKNMINNWW
jgi:hypothetical protein